MVEKEQSIWRCLSRLVSGNFIKLELWKFPTTWSSNFSSVLVTLQDLVTLWSRNAIKNCICGEKWGMNGPVPPPPPSSAVSAVF